MPHRLALVWQDSLLSLCFDRPPVTTPARAIPELVDGISYTDAMNSLCDITLRSINTRVHHDMPCFTMVLENVARIEDIYLKSIGCRGGVGCASSLRQRCENCALNLHISFAIAWLCRPALRNRHSPELRTELQLQLIEKCTKNLLACVRAFVQLHSLSILASRSWAVIHNGLSSALLLGLLGETTTNPEVRESLGEILEILSTESEDEGSQGHDRDGYIELSRPHSRAVAVLRRLYNDHVNNSSQNPVADDGRRSQQASHSQLQSTLNATMAPS
jgi:hypothetical protein